MLELYARPFSSYCWKVLIALYERDIPFEYRMLDGDHPENFARLKEAWPVGKFPVLIIDGAPVIEKLDHHRDAGRCALRHCAAPDPRKPYSRP